MTEHAALPRAELTTGSIIRLAPLAQARMVGSQWFVWGYQLAGLIMGLLLGELLFRIVPVAIVIGGRLVPSFQIIDVARIMLAILGWSIGLNLAQSRHRRRFLAGIQKRGTPESVSATYAAADDALHIDGLRIRYRVAWDAILEIIPSPEGWLVQIDTITFQLPKRAFASEEDERAFLRIILERSRPEVRDRSPEAAVLAFES